MDFDCTKCGACCVEAGAVPVKPADCIPDELVEQDEKHGPVLKRHLGGRCKQLTGVLGMCVGCAIYDERPSVCRKFRPGSDGCLSARQVMERKIKFNMEWKPRGYGVDWKETV